MRYRRGTDGPGDPEGDSARAMRDRGAAAVEAAGLTVLAAMIVVAIMATPIAKTMTAYTGATVDKILDTGDDVSTGPSLDGVDAAGAPTKQAAAAVAAALSQAGKAPYVWGAKGPNAFDCSGLMYWAYQQAGVTIPASSQTQFAGVPRVPGGTGAKLKPGDLVFFHITSDAQAGINHVGMYIGKGQVVEASTSQAPLSQQIKVAPLSSFGSQYVGAGRPTG